MVDELDKTPIQDRVRQRFADDLAANRREQEEVTGQITGLQKRLEQLRMDEAWLTQAQGSLPEALPPGAPGVELDGSSAEQPEASAEEAGADVPHTVPQPRQDQSEKAAQPKRPAKKAAARKTTAKKAAAKKATAKKAAAEPAPAPEDTETSARKTTAKKTAAKKATAKKAAAEPAPAPEDTSAESPAEKTASEEKSGPPLREIILGILLKTPGQPCVAREITDQLSQDHPTRATSIQTVRNNLETLVKKNLAEKSHQQGNAMYTAYTDAGMPPASAADEPVGSDGEQAPEAEAEKVPAQV
ncbi:hypothetical protein [Streptomyces sp. NPDC002553]|uniref:hypothetical protein n=1 Tax=Streptomyces sp. NPDC002553 TaxID=3154417 RepID=UPI0033269BA8